MSRHVPLGICVLGALLLAACAAPEGRNELHLVAALSGDQEDPPTGSLGTGTADLTLDRATNKLVWRVTYSGLSEPVTAVHFHSPERRGSDAEINIRDHLQSPVTGSHRKQLADLAVKSRLPTIYPRSDFVEDGGLMSYGTSFVDLSRRAATYVDKILKGAKPADLPVEQPTKFELIINLKAAKQIGLTIPPNVLARADKVIR